MQPQPPWTNYDPSSSNQAGYWGQDARRQTTAPPSSRYDPCASAPLSRTWPEQAFHPDRNRMPASAYDHSLRVPPALWGADVRRMTNAPPGSGDPCASAPTSGAPAAQDRNGAKNMQRLPSNHSLRAPQPWDNSGIPSQFQSTAQFPSSDAGSTGFPSMWSQPASGNAAPPGFPSNWSQPASGRSLSRSADSQHHMHRNESAMAPLSVEESQPRTNMPGRQRNKSVLAPRTKQQQNIFMLVGSLACLISVIVIIVVVARVIWCKSENGRCNWNTAEDVAPGRAFECQRKLHTYLFFTDSGCFPHFTWDGNFLTNDDGRAYKNKFCPFAEDTGVSQLRRSLLFWYRTLATECFSLDDPNTVPFLDFNGMQIALAEYRSKQCPLSKPEEEAKRKELAQTQQHESVAPFSMTDLGHSCFIGYPSRVAWRLPQLEAWLRLGFKKPYNDWVLEPDELCKVFLQLPLMFGAIGFDWRGIMWEETIVRSVTTFYGVLMDAGSNRKGDAMYCLNDTEHDRGDSSLGRLVLRAMLPTYFRHAYVDTPREVVSWGASTRSLIWGSHFHPTQFRKQLKNVCRAARSSTPHQNLDDLLANLSHSKLFSSSVIDRDDSTCYGHPEKCDYHRCNICPSSQPCFDVNAQSCQSQMLSTSERTHCSRTQTLQNFEGSTDREPSHDCPAKLADPSYAECPCLKSICWFFTEDFKVAMDSLADNPDCAPLLKAVKEA